MRGARAGAGATLVAAAMLLLAACTGGGGSGTITEIERYVVWPGQACSYKIGHNKWLELRNRAQQKLGARFSLGWFHDVLLEGSMPLALLDRRVNERIAERLAAG